MDEALLREACRNYDEMRMKQLVQSLKTQPIHTFSKRYEKEKQRIIWQHERYNIITNQFEGHKLPKRFWRVLLIAALLFLSLVGTALAFEPVRHYIFSYFDGTDIIFQNDQIRDSLNECFTYIPQGYVLEKEEHDRIHNYYLYTDGSQNELVISTIENGGVVSINSENVGYEIIEINGQIGFLVERDTGLIVTWSTGKYTHRIVADITQTSRISKEDIILIAKSRITK